MYFVKLLMFETLLGIGAFMLFTAPGEAKVDANPVLVGAGIAALAAPFAIKD